MVTHYTQLKLNISRDKLPALSGVVKQLLTLRPDNEYLAGLWRESFLGDLLWSSDGDILPRSTQRRAPLGPGHLSIPKLDMITMGTSSFHVRRSLI
jgi:hypothetical protein